MEEEKFEKLVEKAVILAKENGWVKSEIDRALKDTTGEWAKLEKDGFYLLRSVIGQERKEYVFVAKDED